MAEIMAVEAIIDAYWLLQGFWTKPRFAFQTAKGGWSDVDVLAYHPEDRHLVIAESKVQSRKNVVLAYNSEIRHNNGKSFFEWERYDYFNFIDHIEIVCRESFKSFSTMVSTLTIQLVSNYYLSEDVRQESEQQVQAHVKSLMNHDNVKVVLQTTLEVFCHVVKLEKDREQGRLYGNFVIDIARELNRYMDPSIRGAGSGTEDVKNCLIEPLRVIFDQTGLLARWREE
jgi:hypothetical protein